MRKRLVMAILFAISSPFLFAQGFDKGKIAIDLGAGLGIYGLNSNDKANPDNSSGAGAWLIPVRAEYCLTKRFGIGLYADPQFYISNPDSGDAATGLSIGLLTAFHLYNGKSSTLLARLGVGGAGLRYERTKNGVTESVRGGGTNILLGLCYKKYFGDVAGFFVSMDYSATSLSRFEDEKGTLLKVNNPLENFTLNMRGVNTTLGLALKF